MAALNLILMLFLTQPQATAADAKFKFELKQEFSSRTSDDPSPTKKSSKDHAIFNTEVSRLNVQGQATENWNYRVRYAFNSPGFVTNTLEYGYLEYAVNPAISLRGGRQIFLIGGYEANYFGTGELAMYSLAALNVVGKWGGGYVDALSSQFRYNNHTIKLIAGNSNSPTPSTSQKAPFIGSTWEGQYQDNLIMTFLSLHYSPQPEVVDSASAVITKRKSEYKLGSAALRLRYEKWETYWQVQRYDFGQTTPGKSMSDTNDNINIYLSYAQAAHLQKLILSETTVKLEETLSQKRQGISYSYEYKTNPIVLLYAAINYYRDEFQDSRGNVHDTKLMIGYRAAIEF